MPFTNIYIHYVWATKNRERILTNPLRHLLFDHIRLNAKSKKIIIDRINGHLEHVHCLICLQPTQTVDNIAKLLKGESSHWFNNKSKISHHKLAWQDDYFAVSVSKSSIDTVRSYIDNQELHHQKKTFTEEYAEFIKKYSFESK